MKSIHDFQENERLHLTMIILCNEEKSRLYLFRTKDYIARPVYGTRSS